MKTKFSYELLVSIAILALTLELSVYFNFIPAQLIPPPSDIFKSYWQNQSDFLKAFSETLVNCFNGFFLSVFFGLILSFIFSLSQFLRKAILPLSVFFQTVPIIALAPLLVIYFGFGAPTVIASSMIVSIFPILANTLSGLNQTPREQLELFQVYKASPWQILWKLKIPNAYPSIVSGLKISSGLSIIGTIAGEFVAGGGLGAMIDAARTQQRVDQVFVCLILLALMGLLMLGCIHSLNYFIQKLKPLDCHIRVDFL